MSIATSICVGAKRTAMVGIQSRLVAVACICFLLVPGLQGARQQGDSNDRGLHDAEASATLAAQLRRQKILGNIKSTRSKYPPVDDRQDFETIKKMMLEVHEFDARVLQSYIDQMGGDGKRSNQSPRKTTYGFGPLKNKNDPFMPEFCKHIAYRKTTMKTIREAPFIGLFNDLRGLARFEGSSVTYANGAYYAIFDSLRAVAKMGLGLTFRGADNILIPEDAGEAESQFEGLQYMPASGNFLAVRESIDHVEHGLVPFTEEIQMNERETEWTLVSACPVKFYGLQDPNKGWEGIHYFEKDKERYLLGLCESNYCKTIIGPNPPGMQRGNGRAVLTRWEEAPANDTDTCHWEVVKEINLPKEAYFLDYAGIAFYPHPFGQRVAVVSQEDASVWVGEFDWEKIEFVPGGQVYHFPRDSECRKQYCNVEGLTFLDEDRLLFASDRSKNIQSFECMYKDQSVHIFALP